MAAIAITGAYRVGGTVNLNNPTGLGDLLSLRVLALLVGPRLRPRRLSGAARQSRPSGVAYSHIHYDLGREFSALDADGTADIVSVFASYPLVRSRDTNLYALAGADAKWFEDRIGLASTVTERRAKVLSLGLSGDHRDYLLGGGWNCLFGRDRRSAISTSAAPLDRAIDRPHRAQRRAASASSSRASPVCRRLTGPLSLYASLRGQLAFDNLDSSEKMELGGAYGVRAYPEGEAYGDQGYVATAEARLMLPHVIRLAGQVPAVRLRRCRRGRLRQEPVVRGLQPRASQRLRRRPQLGRARQFPAQGDLCPQAGRPGGRPPQPDRDGRFWFQIAKTF